MKIIDLKQSFYCLSFVNREGVEQVFLQQEIAPVSKRFRIDLFESERAARRWIKAEQAIFADNEQWKWHALYDRLFPKRIFITEFSALMRKNEDIDSITLVSESGVRRLYFRDDLENGFSTFPSSLQKIYPKEPIYIIHRQKALDEQIILQKDAYFVAYPEIATPLFSPGILEWADDLISRRPNDGYYIEETTLHDVYMRTELEDKDPGFFILSKEYAPHYILRKADLKKIIDGDIDYR